MKDGPHEEKRALEAAEAARETTWTQPSFIGQLFLGRLHTELVFPFPAQDQTDRQTGDEILARLKTFLNQQVDADSIDRKKQIPEEVVDGLRKLGLFGIKVPQGLTTEHRCDFMSLKGIQNGLLKFDQVRVPKENIVQGLGRGLSLALRTLNVGRLTLPAA